MYDTLHAYAVCMHTHYLQGLIFFCRTETLIYKLNAPTHHKWKLQLTMRKGTAMFEQIQQHIIFLVQIHCNSNFFFFSFHKLSIFSCLLFSRFFLLTFKGISKKIKRSTQLDKNEEEKEKKEETYQYLEGEGKIW